MADDFFSGLQNGLQDLLPNKISYAVPEQIKAIRGVGEGMLDQKRAPGPYGWANALDTVSGDLLGAMLMNKAGELEKGGLEKGAEAVSSFDPSGGGDAASGASGTAQTAGGAPVVNAADISTRLETGKTDPMQGLGSISPDTNGSKSYGNFALNSQPGYSAHGFKQTYGDQLGLTATPGTPEFDAQWKAGVAANPAAFRAAELDWYGKNVSAGIPAKLEKVGVSPGVAADPHVTAYFSDRVVQQGAGSITSAKHAARIQSAYQAGGDDPVKFIKAMSLADRTPQAMQSDFPAALRSGVYSQRSHDNRVMGREALSLGLQMPAAGAGGPAGAPSATAISPMVNAIAGNTVAGISKQGPGEASPPFVEPSPETPGQSFAQRDFRAPPAPVGIGDTVRALGAPSPALSPTGAIGGAPPAPAAPPGAAAITSAIARPPAGGGGAVIPPSLPMSSLPSAQRIKDGVASGIPSIVDEAKKLNEIRTKALTPLQFKAPDGSMLIGTPYTGYKRMGLQGMPDMIKTPYEYPGGIKGENISTLGTTPQGAPGLVPMQTIAPPGAAAPTGGGLPPMPSPSDPAAMVDWGIQAGAQRKEAESTAEERAKLAPWAVEAGAQKKAAEATAEERAKGFVKPVNEAVESATDATKVMQELNIMEDAYKQGGVGGGPMGKWLLEGRGLLAHLGIEPKGITQAAIVEKFNTQMASDLTKELGSNMAASTIMMQIKANPGLLMNDKSSMYLIGIRKQQEQQKIDLGNIAAKIPDPSKWLEVKQAYLASHPIKSPFDGKPISSNNEDVNRELNNLSAATGVKIQARAPIAPTPAAIADLSGDPTQERISSFGKVFGISDDAVRGLLKKEQSSPSGQPSPPATQAAPQMMFPGVPPRWQGAVQRMTPEQRKKYLETDVPPRWQGAVQRMTPEQRKEYFERQW